MDFKDKLQETPRVTDCAEMIDFVRIRCQETTFFAHVKCDVPQTNPIVFGLRPDPGPWALGLGPQAQGLGPWALGLGPWALGLGPWASGLRPRALGLGPWASGPGPRALGLGPRALGLGRQAQALGSWALGPRPRPWALGLGVQAQGGVFRPQIQIIRPRAWSLCLRP